MASTVFLAYAIVGAIMLLADSIAYGNYSDNLLAIGIACGAIGLPRAVLKGGEGQVGSINLLGFIESAPVVSVVFFVFIIVSSVSLGTTDISFGEFSDNLMKVGIACGAVGIPRAVEKAGSIE